VPALCRGVPSFALSAVYHLTFLVIATGYRRPKYSLPDHSFLEPAPAQTVSGVMVSSFLHNEKTLPPDELMERDGPSCRTCGERMSISKVETQLSDSTIRSKRTYECIYCGEKEIVRVESGGP
jgi:hypothetical protein